MNERERLVATLQFRRPDRIPFAPGGPRESTLAAWRTQGLPEGVPWMAHLRDLLGLPPEPALDRATPGVDFRMIPHFEEKILERRASTLVVQDWKGNICEISDRFTTRHLRAAIDFVTRRWIKCPVETRDDWEAMKPRYDVDAPGRWPDDFADRCRRMKDRRHAVEVVFNGPFWQLREWCGFEGLCLKLLDEPAFVHEMVAFWRSFISRVLDRLLAHVVPDVVMICEDMAYKHKAMISPAMCREFLVPSWTDWAGQCRAAGVPVMEVDSDGYVGELIPLWIESGIHCNIPMEVAAGNDIVAYRRQFGSAMAYRGGVDKRAMARGGAAIAAELDRVRPVIEDGGFIPGCDHGVPPDVAWPNFVDYARRLAQLTGWL